MGSEPMTEERVTNATLAQNDALILQRMEQMDGRLADLCACSRADHDALTRMVAVVEAHQQQHTDRDGQLDERIKGLETRDKVWGGLLVALQGIVAAVLGTR